VIINKNLSTNDKFKKTANQRTFKKKKCGNKEVEHDYELFLILV